MTQYWLELKYNLGELILTCIANSLVGPSVAWQQTLKMKGLNQTPLRTLHLKDILKSYTYTTFDKLMEQLLSLWLVAASEQSIFRLFTLNAC